MVITAARLQDAVTAGAGAAQIVALKESQVIVPDLEHVPVTMPLPAPLARPGPRLEDAQRQDVLAAAAPVLVVGALAPLAEGGWVEVTSLSLSAEVEKVRHEGGSPEAERLRAEAQQNAAGGSFL